MTNQQLYLAIGVPSALFALNFLAILAQGFWQAKRFDDMAKRFDDLKDVFRAEMGRVADRVGRVEDRVKALEGETHSKIVR